MLQLLNAIISALDAHAAMSTRKLITMTGERRILFEDEGDSQPPDGCPDHGCAWTLPPWPTQDRYCDICGATWSPKAIASARASQLLEDVED